MRLQAIEYLNISGLVIDFATSPVPTGNSFFDFLQHYGSPIILDSPVLNIVTVFGRDPRSARQLGALNTLYRCVYKLRDFL